ncbi:MAG: hypothetical protein JSU73_14080 [candidate division WOR-3 bacterium]|nr:MAG: hypothetical protein JSU73_14080 [candidate division WOR-3 bacterium]
MLKLRSAVSLLVLCSAAMSKPAKILVHDFKADSANAEDAKAATRAMRKALGRICGYAVLDSTLDPDYRNFVDAADSAYELGAEWALIGEVKTDSTGTHLDYQSLDAKQARVLQSRKVALPLDDKSDDLARDITSRMVRPKAPFGSGLGLSVAAGASFLEARPAMGPYDPYFDSRLIDVSLSAYHETEHWLFPLQFELMRGKHSEKDYSIGLSACYVPLRRFLSPFAAAGGGLTSFTWHDTLTRTQTTSGFFASVGLGCLIGKRDWPTRGIAAAHLNYTALSDDWAGVPGTRNMWVGKALVGLAAPSPGVGELRINGAWANAGILAVFVAGLAWALSV